MYWKELPGKWVLIKKRSALELGHYIWLPNLTYCTCAIAPTTEITIYEAIQCWRCCMACCEYGLAPEFVMLDWCGTALLQGTTVLCVMVRPYLVSHLFPFIVCCVEKWAHLLACPILPVCHVHIVSYCPEVFVVVRGLPYPVPCVYGCRALDCCTTPCHSFSHCLSHLWYVCPSVPVLVLVGTWFCI